MWFDLPLLLVLPIVFVFGCVLGSFLDVVVLRFHTGKSINGRSRCLSCGHTLSWFELFPILSYVFLRGRCRACHAHIPQRLIFMEIGLGFLFMEAWFLSNSYTEFVWAAAFVMLATVITLYDIRHYIIPNLFVAVMYVLAAVSLWWFVGFDSWSLLSFHVISGICAASFYFLLWVISRGQWIGLGDAKLALPLGLILHPLQTFSFVVLSFWVGAAISLTILTIQWVLRRGQKHLRFYTVPLTMKSEVPFAPFLLIAFILVYYFRLDILSLF